jgi:hypothetical protein
MALIPTNHLREGGYWPLGSVAVVLISDVLMSSTGLAQDEHLTRTTKANEKISILSYARSNQDCEGIDPPSFYLDKAPDHGIVCFRAGTIKLQNAIVGNLTQCIGKHIRGVTVVYVPQEGYVGPDEVRYMVIFPEARHSVFVDLAVVQGQAKSAVSGQGGLPVEVSQPPGSLPACIEAVS